MHFICHSSANITLRKDGFYSSGFWDVGFDSASSVETIYLHEAKNDPAYWVGKVKDIQPGEWQGKQRVIFVCELSEETGQPWEGEGAGEKGYGY